MVRIIQKFQLSHKYFFAEAERFDKDFAVVDKQVRESGYDVKLAKLNNLR
jgi:hypothetical protein